MLALEAAVRRSGLEPLLLELVKLRASQLNGCAYCLDMHSRTRARGENEQRLHVLAARREAPFYSERDRAALAWCEALTLLPESGAPDDVYSQVDRSSHGRDRGARLPDRGDQRLEPARCRIPLTGRRLRLAIPCRGRLSRWRCSGGRSRSLRFLRSGST